METCIRCGLTDMELLDNEQDYTWLSDGDMICYYCYKEITGPLGDIAVSAKTRDRYIRAWLDRHGGTSI